MFDVKSSMLTNTKMIYEWYKIMNEYKNDISLFRELRQQHHSGWTPFGVYRITALYYRIQEWYVTNITEYKNVISIRVMYTISLLVKILL